MGNMTLNLCCSFGAKTTHMRYFYTFFLLLASAVVLAQGNPRISGSVNDAEGKGLSA